MKRRPRTPAAARPELFRALVDRVGSGAALLDAGGCVLYANPFLERLLGRKLRGRPFSHVLRGRDSARFTELLTRAKGELEVFAGLIPLALRLDREGSILVLLVEDLRPRRRLENTLLSGRLNRLVLNEVSEIVVYVDRQGTVLRASASAWRMSGRNPIGRPFDECFPLRLFERRKRAALYAANLQAALALPGGFRCHALMPLADGSVRHLAVTSRPIIAQKGVDGGAVVVMTDISDTKAREIELRRANESLQRRVEERTARLLLLYDLARTSNEAESVEQALSLALERLCRNGEWRVGHAVLRGAKPKAALTLESSWPTDEAGLMARLSPLKRALGPRDPLALALESGRLVTSKSLASHLGARGRAAAQAGLHSVAAVPIKRGPEVLGALELFSPLVRPLDEGTNAALVAAGLQLGEVIDRKRLQREFAEAVSQEHETIGRELHDSVGQELTGLSLMMRAMPEAAGGKRDNATEEIAQGLQRVLREVHDLSRGVFPAELRNLGLAGGIARLAQTTAKRSGFRVIFDDAAGTLPLDAQTCLQVFRVAQEAVNNAVKYSGGDEVRIRLRRRGDLVELDVQDNGRGLPVKRSGLTGSGLRIMRFRAESIGGALRFARSTSGGARITCRWKLQTGDGDGRIPPPPPREN